VYASYSAAVFICGGSGISFGLSAVQELVQRHLEGTSRVEVIELIWIVQDPGKQRTSSMKNETANILAFQHPWFLSFHYLLLSVPPRSLTYQYIIRGLRQVSTGS
jgi:hypothetical protein